MSQSNIKPNTLAFVGLSNEYCVAVENARESERDDFVASMTRLLPRIYISASDLDADNQADSYIDEALDEDYYDSVRRNIERGTADIISVSALLDACGDIPDFDEVQKTDRGHWENRIKTPLETALDSCVRAGVLDGWEYCGAKKAKLSDSEVDIGDYATFIGLYVRFRMGRMNDED